MAGPVIRKRAMTEPSLYEKIHWKIFNMAARFVGCCMVIVCSIFVILIIGSFWGIKFAEAYPKSLLIPFLLLIPLGFLIIKAKPYYPEKYREWFETKEKKI
jgi:hypothetical protein